MTFDDLIIDAVGRVNWPVASTRKSGRDARWPYVPVLITTDPETNTVRSAIIRGLAYETRAEAEAIAHQAIENMKARLASELRRPTNRALRRQHGLPEQVVEVGN